GRVGGGGGAGARVGAAAPTAAWVGSRPIKKVAIPINMRVATSVLLRPMRSPKWPKIMAPTGRAANPTAWVPNESKRPAYGELPGKKRSGKTRAAAVPDRKKTDHSMGGPTGPATTAERRRGRGRGP